MSISVLKLGHNDGHLHGAVPCCSKKGRGRSLCTDWERLLRCIKHKSKAQNGVDKTQPFVPWEKRI